MTREELKRHCLLQIEGCEMWAKYNGEEPHGKIYEEHKLILELLEQEPCEVSEYDKDHIWYKGVQYISLRRFLEAKAETEQEPCEDAISRAEALKMIDDINIPEDMSVFEIKSHIGVEIGTLPLVTPMHKVGEWIKKNNDYFDWYECSECGYGSDGEMKYNRLCDVRTKFCPDCGSQMLEVENEIN